MESARWMFSAGPISERTRIAQADLSPDGDGFGSLGYRALYLLNYFCLL
jgi:hypothetical protein